MLLGYSLALISSLSPTVIAATAGAAAGIYGTIKGKALTERARASFDSWWNKYDAPEQEKINTLGELYRQYVEPYLVGRDGELVNAPERIDFEKIIASTVSTSSRVNSNNLPYYQPGDKIDALCQLQRKISGKTQKGLKSPENLMLEEFKEWMIKIAQPGIGLSKHLVEEIEKRWHYLTAISKTTHLDWNLEFIDEIEDLRRMLASLKLNFEAERKRNESREIVVNLIGLSSNFIKESLKILVDLTISEIGKKRKNPTDLLEATQNLHVPHYLFTDDIKRREQLLRNYFYGNLVLNIIKTKHYSNCFHSDLSFSNPKQDFSLDVETDIEGEFFKFSRYTSEFIFFLNTCYKLRRVLESCGSLAFSEHVYDKKLICDIQKSFNILKNKIVETVREIEKKYDSEMENLSAEVDKRDREDFFYRHIWRPITSNETSTAELKEHKKILETIKRKFYSFVSTASGVLTGCSSNLSALEAFSGTLSQQRNEAVDATNELESAINELTERVISVQTDDAHSSQQGGLDERFNQATSALNDGEEPPRHSNGAGSHSSASFTPQRNQETKRKAEDESPLSRKEIKIEECDPSLIEREKRKAA